MNPLWFSAAAVLRAGRRRGIRPSSGLRRLVGARDGVSAIEFALIASIFVVLLLNVVDFALLIWSQMEVDYAAQAGVQAAYNTCSPGKMPATANCSDLNGAVTVAAQSTSLGSAVSLAGGSPSEGYFCTIGASLTELPVGPPSPAPPDCTLAGDPTTKPGDYISVDVNYTFKPLFAGLSLARQHTLTAGGFQRLQ